jgi:hypothetical protein
MIIVDDKEVGQMWLDALAVQDGRAILLIRKLVKERARQYLSDSAALADFGIDPKTWE